MGSRRFGKSLVAHVFCIWYLVFRMGAKSGFELARINLDPQHYRGRARRSRSVCPGGRTGMPAPPPHVRLLSSMPDLPTTPLFEDSQCCIDVARGGGSFKKLRHIPCRRVLHLPLHRNRAVAVPPLRAVSG